MSCSYVSVNIKPEHEEFHRLYSDHHGWLFGWLHRKLGCFHQAENLAQDTFCRLLNLKDLTELNEPRAFLTTTASRLIIDNVRRKQVEQRYLEMHAYYHGEVESAPSAEQLAIVTETLSLITEMLDGLPVKCQKAFLMNRLDGMKHQEIADQLGVSKHSVKQYIARAMVQCYHIVYGDKPLI